MHGIRRRDLICSTALAAALLTGICGPTPARAEPKTFVFQIPAEPLSQALQDYGRTAGRQLLFASELTAGRMAPAVIGAATPADALTRLLAGSGLVWRVTASGAIMIQRQDLPAPQRAAAAGDAEILPELTVVGSRLARKQDGPAPVTVFTGEKIAALGVSSVADVLNYLPQQTFTLGDGFNVGGARPAQLRGLTAGTTLVLINGRRVVPGAISVTGGYFDLNTVPLAAVERVEVLADSASAVYGADAIGGVVNLVTKSHIDRPVLDMSYGAADGGAEERRVSLSFGGATPRARGLLIVDYFERGLLLGADRARTANADYRAFGGADNRATTSEPGNICVATGVLPGLTARCAAVPAGSSGVGLTPASFAATAGLRNLASPQAYASLVPPSRRYSAMATGEADLAPNLTAFGEWMYADRRDESRLAPPVISNGLVAAANPFNPFGVAVRADFLLTGIGSVVNLAHEISQRELVGLRGRAQGWDWELTALGAQSDADFQSNNRLDATRVAAALSATTPALALNLFQDGPGGSFALLRSLVADPSTNASHRTTREIQVGGFTRGDIVNLPAGPLQAVIGAEWRRESMSAFQPGSNIAVGDGRARRESSSLYAESQVPLVDQSALGGLSVTLAGRYDRYSDFGGTTNGQYGLEWRPRPSLLMRASYGQSFRAPGLWSLFQPVTSGPGTVLDPRRGSQNTPITVTIGGNAGLDPEKSTSSSFGAVWTPRIPGRPRFSVSWWRIDQNLRILPYVTASSIVANEAVFANRVVRAAATAADLAAGQPGQILTVDARLVNVGSLQTHGLDLEATADVETRYGTFAPTVSATRVGSYVAADFPTTPAYERVGLADYNGTVPRWRAVGSLAWRLDCVSASLTARYVSSYADTNLNVRNGATVKAQTLFDLQGAVRLEDVFKTAAIRGVTIRAGATNLFDATPRYSGVTGAGYDPYMGDLRGRFLYLAAAKSF